MRGLIAPTLGCWSLWRMPSDFHPLIRPLPAALKPYVRQFRYALHDLSPQSDAEIKGG